MARLNAVQLRVPDEPVAVEPGTAATYEVEVFNASDIVDEYAIDTVGIDPRWVAVEPEEVGITLRITEVVAVEAAGSLPVQAHFRQVCIL